MQKYIHFFKYIDLWAYIFLHALIQTQNIKQTTLYYDLYTTLI